MLLPEEETGPVLLPAKEEAAVEGPEDAHLWAKTLFIASYLLYVPLFCYFRISASRGVGGLPCRRFLRKRRLYLRTKTYDLRDRATLRSPSRYA